MGYQLVKETKLNQDFRVHAELCVYTFTVDLPDHMGARWRADDLVQAHIDELDNQGSILLELRLYEDKSAAFSTDYMVEVIASASPLFWQLIALGVLAVLAIIFTYLTVRQVEDIVEYSPGAAAAIGFGAGAIALVVLGIIALNGSK